MNVAKSLLPFEDAIIAVSVAKFFALNAAISKFLEKYLDAQVPYNNIINGIMLYVTWSMF